MNHYDSSAPCLYKDDRGKCYETVDNNSGYCKKHKQPFRYNVYGEGLPKDMNRRKSAVLQRDKGVCYICKSDSPKADAVEHIVPRSEGGSDALFNLKAVHHNVPPYCHREKTAQDANRAKAMNKPKRRGR
jgi:5-methylcytosine-specific restriction protein A